MAELDDIYQRYGISRTPDKDKSLDDIYDRYRLWPDQEQRDAEAARQKQGLEFGPPEELAGPASLWDVAKASVSNQLERLGPKIELAASQAPAAYLNDTSIPTDPMGLIGFARRQFIEKPLFGETANRLAAEGAQGLQEALPGIQEKEAILQREVESASSPRTAKLLAAAPGMASSFAPPLAAAGTFLATRNPVLAGGAAKVAAAIPAADAYAESYMTAKRQGMSDSDAQQYAAQQAGLEYAFEAFVPGAGKTALGTVAKKAIGEGATETATGTAQDALSYITDLEKGTQLAPKDFNEFIEARGTEFILGSMAGGAISAPTAKFETDAAVRAGMEEFDRITGESNKKLTEDLTKRQRERDVERVGGSIVEQALKVQRDRERLRQAGEASAKPPQIQDILSGKISEFPPIVPIGETGPQPDLARQAELERDYLFQQQERLNQQVQEPSRKPIIEGGDALWNFGVPENARGALAEAFREAGLRRAGGIRGENLYPDIRSTQQENTQRQYFKPTQNKILEQTQEQNILPLSTRIPEPPTRPQSSGAPPVQPTAIPPTVLPEDQEVELTPEEEARFRASIAPELNQVINQEATNRNIQRVETELETGPDRGVRDSIRQLRGSGRLQIVTGETLPEGASSATSKGFFDGTNLYLNADLLGEGEARPTALHEIKHFMDQQSGQVTQRSLLSIIGDEGNTRVNQRITELAQSKNKIAQDALSAVESVDPSVRSLELPAYFIEFADQARQSKGTLGRAAGVVKDIVSMAKAKIKDTFNIDLGLSDNDIYYLGRQLAKAAPKIQGDGKQALESRIGQYDFSPTKASRRVVQGDTAITYTSDGKTAKIDLIRTQPDARGTGSAKKAMQSFLKSADEQGITVNLLAAEQDSKTDPKRLVKFYEDMGFQTGEMVDDSPRMTRLPAGLESRARPAPQKKVQRAGLVQGTPGQTDAKDLLKTVPGVNKRVKERAPLTTDSLPKRAKELTGRVWSAVFHGAGRAPIDVNEVFEKQRGTENVSNVRARQMINRLDRSIIKLPKNQKSTVLRTISEASGEDQATRDAARATLQKNHPEVYRGYQDLRNSIKQMGLDVVKSILNKGKPLTNRDVATIKKIMQDGESYISRSYKVSGYGSKVAKQWARFVHNPWEQWKQGKGELTEEAKIFEDAKEYVKAFTLDIGNFDQAFDPAGPGKVKPMPLEELEALYQQWVTKKKQRAPLEQGATEDQRDAYVNDLMQQLVDRRKELEKSGEYKKLLEEKAVDLTKHLLGVYRGAAPKLVEILRGSLQDETIISRRKNVPEPIRKLWGEVTDPIAQLHTTFIRQAEFLARDQMLRELYDIGKDRYFVDQDQPTDGSFTEELTSEKLGPLQGVKATPRFAEAVNAYVAPASNLDVVMSMLGRPTSDQSIKLALAHSIAIGLDKVGKLGRAWKFTRTVMNPASHVFNFAGGPLVMIGNGFNPVPVTKKDFQNYGKAVKAAAGLIDPADRQSFNQYSQEILGQYLQDSGQVGEIQKADMEVLKAEVLGEQFEKSKLRDVLGKAKRVGSDVYAMTDAVWKFAAYFKEKDFLEAYYKARKETRTEEQIRREAAERIKQRNITYNRSMPLARLGDASTLTAFMPYFAETYRAIGRTLWNGWKDVQNGLAEGGKSGNMLAMRGLSQIGGATSNIFANRALLPAYAVLAAGARTSYSDDDDDELAKDVARQETIKKALRKTDQQKSLQLAAFQPGQRAIFFDISRAAPYEPAANTISAIAAGDVDGAWEQVKSQIFQNALVSQLTGAFGRTVEDARVRDSSVKKQYPALYADMLDSLTDMGIPADKAKEIIQTGYIATPAPAANALGQLYEGKPVGDSGALAAMNAAGYRFTVVDPSVDIPARVGNEYVQVINRSRQKMKDLLNTKSPSIENIQRTYVGLAQDELEAWQVVREQVEAARSIGYEDKDIRQLLEDAGMNKSDINDAMNGELDETKFFRRKDLVNAKKEAIQQAAEGEEREAIRQKYNEITYDKLKQAIGE